MFSWKQLVASKNLQSGLKREEFSESIIVKKTYFLHVKNNKKLRTCANV